MALLGVGGVQRAVRLLVPAEVGAGGIVLATLSASVPGLGLDGDRGRDWKAILLPRPPVRSKEGLIGVSCCLPIIHGVHHVF